MALFVALLLDFSSVGPHSALAVQRVDSYAPTGRRLDIHFLATLVALHFTPVSRSVSQPVGRVSD